MNEVDYIIVGQGLAGSAAAVQLLKREKQILVIDEFHKNTSSRIAAGLFNPVTGKNSVKTWLADEIFPYLSQFYAEVENRTGKKFLYSLPLYRPFASVREQNDWMAKSADAAYSPYILSLNTKSAFPELKDPYGGLILGKSGYLSTTTYLSSVREWIKERSFVLDEFFDDSQLSAQNGNVTYKNFIAKKIIFCQGERCAENRWFGHLPIRPLKGETILIKSDWKRELIINRGVYMVPGVAAGEFRVGSTYKFNDRTPFTTMEGQHELKEKLNDLVDIPYQIISQEWGVRPTTIDRRPILGNHPTEENFVIFNGLGTKGVSLAPYFSEVLIRWLENGDMLHKEVSIARYK